MLCFNNRKVASARGDKVGENGRECFTVLSFKSTGFFRINRNGEETENFRVMKEARILVNIVHLKTLNSA